jgi:hypothetical protein
MDNDPSCTCWGLFHSFHGCIGNGADKFKIYVAREANGGGDILQSLQELTKGKQ